MMAATCDSHTIAPSNPSTDKSALHIICTTASHLTTIAAATTIASSDVRKLQLKSACFVSQSRSTPKGNLDQCNLRNLQIHQPTRYQSSIVCMTHELQRATIVTWSLAVGFTTQSASFPSVPDLMITPEARENQTR